MDHLDSLRPNINGGHDGDEEGDERGEHEDGLALSGAPHRPGELTVHLEAHLESETANLKEFTSNFKFACSGTALTWASN